MLKQIKIEREIINPNKLFLNQTDIYSGEESIRFNNRHPIYRALMKIEFEEVLRSYRNMRTKD
ncbi:MAG: hypothetical protein KGD70_07355 [Candidatus Lokiarchaeota archaeon]|nr:hypothetical protein [Candidatus Lokiarchaeota archaeon]